jgi:hypothetical protein
VGNTTINTEVWDALRAKLGKAVNSYVKVGVLASQGGSTEVANGITLTDLAAIHEYGSEAAHVKERSYMRSTFRRTEVAEANQNLCAKLARGIILEKVEFRTALDKLGAWGANQMKLTIKNRATEGPEEQANAASTIAAKGSSTPLVDTSQLLNALTWEVVAT